MKENITANDVAILNALHMKYYQSKIYCDTYWMDKKVYKCVFDLWVYQEIIFEYKPDIIIETGTAWGGSALFLANVCDAMDNGYIISIDIKKRELPKHKRIHYIIGSSTSKKVITELKNRLNTRPEIFKINTKIMVILDSDHSMKHVSKELEIYSDFVTPGQYLIVEDTNLSGHPIPTVGGPGPFEAVQEFIKKDRRYVIDRSKEKFGLSFNPQGYLKRR